MELQGGNSIYSTTSTLGEAVRSGRKSPADPTIDKAQYLKFLRPPHFLVFHNDDNVHTFRWFVSSLSPCIRGPKSRHLTLVTLRWGVFSSLGMVLPAQYKHLCAGNIAPTVLCGTSAAIFVHFFSTHRPRHPCPDDRSDQFRPRIETGTFNGTTA